MAPICFVSHRFFLFLISPLRCLTLICISTPKRFHRWTSNLPKKCNLQFTDLEWKVLYVGSAHDSHQDQVLDEILVGPVPVGMNKFVLQADAPSVDKLPDDDDLLGVTVVLVTCSYKEREFVRVGYYVNNEYTGEYDEEVGPPKGKNLDLGLVQRQILADKPRVTKFPIPWGNEDEQLPVQQANAMEAKMEAAAGTPLTENDTDMELE